MTINQITADIAYSAIHGLQNLSAGTGAAYTVASGVQALPAYETGRVYPFIPHVVNTGACTVNYDGIAAVPVKTLPAGADPDANYFQPGRLYWLRYDGTNMLVEGLGDGPAGWGGGAATLSGGVVAVNENAGVYTDVMTTVLPANLRPGNYLVLTRLNVTHTQNAQPWALELAVNATPFSQVSIAPPAIIGQGLTQVSFRAAHSPTWLPPGGTLRVRVHRGVAGTISVTAADLVYFHIGGA